MRPPLSVPTASGGQGRGVPQRTSRSSRDDDATDPRREPLMFADRLEIVAAVVATLGSCSSWRPSSPAGCPSPGYSCAPTCSSQAEPRRCCSEPGRRWPTTSTTPGTGATAYDAAVWTFAVEHRDAAGDGDLLRTARRRRHRRALRADRAAGPAPVLRGRRLDAALVVTTPLVGTLLTDVAQARRTAAPARPRPGSSSPRPGSRCRRGTRSTRRWSSAYSRSCSWCAR